VLQRVRDDPELASFIQSLKAQHDTLSGLAREILDLSQQHEDVRLVRGTPESIRAKETLVTTKMARMDQAFQDGLGPAPEGNDAVIAQEQALEAVGGFQVALCGCGAEAIERAPGFAPDLILLDVRMPDMDVPMTLQALLRLSQTTHTGCRQPRQRHRLGHRHRELPTSSGAQGGRRPVRSGAGSRLGAVYVVNVRSNTVSVIDTRRLEVSVRYR
jgi:CheY-like chemotaxis protein